MTDPSFDVDTYAAALVLRVPLFTGWQTSFDVRRAETEADAARARSESVRQQVALEVFRAFHGVRTAARRVGTSRDLLASATESHAAAIGRYRAGVGSILELLDAQSRLEDARAQDVAARADLLTALARLAHDRGGVAEETTR